MPNKHLVLWDGECGFCRRCTVWLRKQSRYDSLQFCPYQEADLTPELREECSKSIHVIKTDGEILKGGRAAMFLGRFTRWNRLARMGEWPIFLPFVEIGYSIVANNRMVFSKLMMKAEK
ncbi:hypothetical protein IAD21_01471 [Abditibacteriota bacterium]|nr:hypothetical protein IAD21_01471 [Abditibacteriota bacterium]